MTDSAATRTHFRTCNLCEAMCGLEITLKNEQIVGIRGDKRDPFSRGHICPKAAALQDITHDPDRLKRPLRRTPSGWEEIDWETAYVEVVTKLRRIQAQYGRNAVAVYQGNPNVHNLGSMLYAAPFVRALGTKNRYSATSVDQLPHHLAALLMFGHQLLLPVPDVDRTQFMLIIGANPLVSNGSLMSAGGIEARLKALRARGGKLVVVDPRRSETAVFADQHCFIRPGTDVLLLLALIHAVLHENLSNPDRLAGFTDGLDNLPELVQPFAPEAVTAATGIPAETIRALARDFCAAESAVCYGRIGTSTQAFGGATTWLINVLNIITGNLDRPGGAMFTLPAIDIVNITRFMGASGRYGHRFTRVRNLPGFGGEFPVATLAEEILTPGEGQIKALVTIAGNPALSTPNGGQLEKALSGLEYMASIDIYRNETTRFANIILPPTTGLETEHYDLIFHALAVRNTAKYSPALFEPEAGARHDWQIFRELRRQLEATIPDRPARKGKGDIFDRLTPDTIIDLGLHYGPYGAWGLKLDGHNLNLPKLKRSPSGIDLGALRPLLPERLCTHNGRIHLLPEVFVQGLARAQKILDAPVQNGELLLIGRRQLRSNNSWMHNAPRLVKGKNRCTLLMHPQDAAARQIHNGQDVIVRSRVGEIELPVEISEAMMPGVVSMPHGWGHNRADIHMQVAQAHAGASINDLTDDQAVDPITGTAAFNGVPVVVIS